jgi:homoserine kinase type II
MKKLNLYELLEGWGVTYSSTPMDKPCFGSPERSVHRIVVADTKGTNYILEQIHPMLKERKQRIAENLQKLVHRNPELTINPYCPVQENTFVYSYGQNYWMLGPYLSAIALERPQYLHDNWRGELMAKFLIDLHRTSEGIDLVEAHDDLPALDDYIIKLYEAIGKNRPEIARSLKTSIAHLEKNLFSELSLLETGFSHGDYHPLNILWGTGDILGVIDWEFSGRRPVLYDLANMLSCLGMEHPDALRKAISQKMIDAIQAEGFASKLSWSKLMDLMLAVRFAWLSEWLRKNDEEMVALELSYMDLLVVWCQDCN